MPATTNAYRAKLFRLGGPGSGNFGHEGRPGEIGGSAPDDGSASVVHHDTKPSVKGKNISSIDDEANDAVVHDILGMNEAQVQDLAASMVQYVDNEQFDVKILTEGGGLSQDELRTQYDDYVNDARSEAQGDWAGTRWERQEEIKRLWEQVSAEENFPDNVDVPEKTFDELTEGLDLTGAFYDDEANTIKELLRHSGGPELLSMNEWRDKWDNEEGNDYEPPQSFEDWLREGGHDGDSGDDPVVRMAFTGSNGTTITREFKHDEHGNLVVDHAWFKTYKTGGGMAKDVMRASFDEYARLGVEKVLVHANIDVGGYAWAKFGFRVTDPPDVDALFRKAEEKGKITHEERVMLEDVATEHEGEDTQLWHIADAKHGDKKIGAAVLLDSNWSGELNLSDDEAMARLRKYIAEVKPKSASAPPPPAQAKSKSKPPKARMGSGTVTEHVLAADPPTPPDGGSREMYYEEDGRRQDRELWRELLGEDFPDEESQPPTPPVNLAADVHAGVKPGGVGAAFTTVPKTARARARWIRRNQSRYDTDPEFKTVADAVTLLTQGASAPLHLASWADGHDPADLLRQQGTPGNKMDQTLTEAMRSLGRPLSSVAHPMGAYTNAFAGQDVAHTDHATVGQAGQALNRAIATAPLVTRPLYRGHRLTLPNPAWQAITTLGPGDPFPMHGATAMTTDADLAEAFARGTATGQPGAAQAKAGLASDQRPVVLMLEPGARGLPVGVLSSWRNAQEVITRGDFTVVRVDGVNGLTRIVLRPSPPMPTSLQYRTKLAFMLGGPGSGNFGHAGRPGEVGGSSDSGGSDAPASGSPDEIEGGGPIRAKWAQLQRDESEAFDQWQSAAHNAHGYGDKLLAIAQARVDKDPKADAQKIWNEEAAKMPDYLKSRNAMNAARKKYGDLEAARVAIEPEMQKEVVRNLTGTVAIALGVDPVTVDVVHQPGRGFEVGDKHFTEAGHYDPRTRRIQINAGAIDYKDAKAVKGIAAHEVSHAIYHQLKAEADSEFERYMAKAIDPHDSDKYTPWFEEHFYRKPGDMYAKHVRPEKAAALAREFPASAVMALMSDGHLFSGISEKMVKENGHSRYAKSYWTEEAVRMRGSGSYEHAINESVAELTRYLTHPASWTEKEIPQPSSPWMKLTTAMHKWYREGSEFRKAGIERLQQKRTHP